MINVSSSFTLFLKIALPTLWITFFGALCVVFFTQDIDYIGPFPIEKFKFGFLGFYFFGVLFLLFSVIRLKRVDMDNQYFYVTNYFKSVRYSYDSIKKIEESDFLLFKTINISLKEKGKFGKKIKFMSSRKRFHNFLTANPQIFAHLLKQ